MIIYEKDNKLNINFENSIEEQPDLQISKENDVTSIKIDGQQSGGSSNLVFDAAKAKRPEIDGVEYDYVYVYKEPQGNTKLGDVCVCDFPNGYPPIVSENGRDSTFFTMVSTASSYLCMAGQELADGDLQPFLLEDVNVVELATASGSYFIFPTTAKFGLRKEGSGK